jgi:NAD(P) transhydrogenase subunit beta
MCKAMNRSLSDILTGGAAARIGEGAGERGGASPVRGAGQHIDHIDILRRAGKVIIVPGYGMAVSQAQWKVKALYDSLVSRGTDVKFAIHPVAGRMPGHMNVLLAEVDIPYEKLCEMDTINPEFSGADVAIVIGACDVVNPAAISAEGTPIYGMPILMVHEAGHVIVCNKDTRPGYSGVDNPLYEKDNVVLQLDNAADSVEKLHLALA